MATQVADTLLEQSLVGAIESFAFRDIEGFSLRYTSARPDVLAHTKVADQQKLLENW